MQHKGETPLTMKDILYSAGQEWHTLTEAQKQVYRDESTLLAAQNQVQACTGVAPLQPGQQPLINQSLISQMQQQQQVGLKKALSPYQCFLKEQKILVMAHFNDNIQMKELVRLGSKKWNELLDHQRQVYNTLGEIERIRFERDRVMLCSGGVQGPLHEMYREVLESLEGKLKDYKPEILIPNFEVMQKVTPIQKQTNQQSLELQIANKVLSELELQQPQPAQSALYFFDRQNRTQILAQLKPQTATEAFQKIKHAFENSSDRHLFEKMARDDTIRFQREQQAHERKLQQQRDIIQAINQKQLAQDLNAIYQHPAVIQLQQSVQNQQSLLVQQASLIQHLVQIINMNGIDINKIEGEPLSAQQQLGTVKDESNVAQESDTQGLGIAVVSQGVAGGSLTYTEATAGTTTPSNTGVSSVVQLQKYGQGRLEESQSESLVDSDE